MQKPSPARAWLCVVALALCALTLSPTARAEQRVVLPSADSTIFTQVQGGSAYDAVSDGGPNVWVSTTARDVVRRALLRFDLSGIPPGTQVLSAELKLTQLRARAVHPVAVHKVTSSWQPASSTAGDFGQGTTANPGDVTWSHRSHPSVSWGQRGGDFVAQASTTLTVQASSTLTYTWPSTAAFVADVQDWVNNPAGNHGLILIGDEVSGQSAKRFAGMEFGDPAAVPALVLTLAPRQDDGDVPLPAWAFWVLGAGLLAAVQRRWG